MLNAARILAKTSAVVVALTVAAAFCGAPHAQTSAEQATEADPTAGMNTKAVAAVPEDLVGKSVVTLEETPVGEVSAVRTDDTGALASIDADIGGFLGIGESTITIPAADFAVSDGVIVLARTEGEVSRMAK